jgi:hypothetical protein
MKWRGWNGFDVLTEGNLALTRPTLTSVFKFTRKEEQKTEEPVRLALLRLARNPTCAVKLLIRVWFCSNMTRYTIVSAFFISDLFIYYFRLNCDRRYDSGVINVYNVSCPLEYKTFWKYLVTFPKFQLWIHYLKTGRYCNCGNLY